MKKITPRPIPSQTVTIPGSKSISHRILISACLCKGTSIITNLLESEDVLLTMNGLKQMGAQIQKTGPGNYKVTGFSGLTSPCKEDIYLGNSGTSMRLLAGIAALGTAPYTLTGNRRMCERPMGELLDALNMLEIKAVSASGNNTPPVIICGGSRQGGRVVIDCTKSSQYLSALLMIAPFFEQGLDISLDTPPVSEPYIQLTIDIMKKFNITAKKLNPTAYQVTGTQHYQPGRFHVEPDLSNAGYFWAIGAVTRETIFVNHVNSNSFQGDLKQVDILEKMGCQIIRKKDRIGVKGGDMLNPVQVDMSDTPDAVPAIAVVASFASGTTRINNIGHLREKECDRIDAIVTQLKNMGIKAVQGDDFIQITGGKHQPGQIKTYNDHRIAMAFSIPGLVTEGIEIENESCVNKSFPNFWDLFDAL